MNYEEHEWAAVEELREHIMTCKHAGDSDIFDRHQEADLAEQDLYSHGSQIKFLQGHILKIKWEAPCSWVGCRWHLYYCKLAKDIYFQEIKEVLN
jgi:hypothetical protein